jgi:hypothetical protein
VQPKRKNAGFMQSPRESARRKRSAGEKKIAPNNVKKKSANGRRKGYGASKSKRHTRSG